MKPYISVEKTPAEKPEPKVNAPHAPEPVREVEKRNEPDLPSPPKFDEQPGFFARYRRQVLYMTIGVVLALLMIYWGFWRTVLLMLFALFGLWIAERQEGRRPLRKAIDWLKKRPPFVK